MNLFEVGDDVYGLLMHEPSVTWYLGDKVFPLVANAKTEYPFAVYRRVSYSRDGDNKDGYGGERCTMDIAIVDPSYSKSVEIAKAVTKCLIEGSTNDIEKIELSNASEDFIDDANVQRLTFTITLTE